MHDPVEASLDTGGDTDPATDTEETHVTLGAKRKVAGLAGSTTRWARNYFNFTRILIMRSQVEAVSSNRSVHVIVDGAFWCHGARRRMADKNTAILQHRLDSRPANSEPQRIAALSDDCNIGSLCVNSRLIERTSFHCLYPAHKLTTL
jgi:hypothetical protein